MKMKLLNNLNVILKDVVFIPFLINLIKGKSFNNDESKYKHYQKEHN